MEKVQPNEIRIILDGGIVQQVALGRDVPRNLKIILTDYDLDGQTPDDDPRIEKTGYGDELAYCAIFHEPGDKIPKKSIDADGTCWF